MASYGKYRDTIVKGEKGTDWYVEIHKKDFSGTSTDMTLGGEGFEITWNGQGSTRDRIFLGSECVLSLMVRTDTDETDLYNILDAGFKEYFIRIYKGSTASANIWWYGWIQPSFDTIENAPYPYVSQITATDSYGYYEKQLFSTFSSEEQKQDNHSLANIYLKYLHNTELAAVNLVEGVYFLDVSKWDILSNDTISNGVLTINGQTGTRKPISCEGDTLVVGENYTAKVNVTSYTTGTLYLVDGGAGTSFGQITSSGSSQTFSWTQTAASGGNGFHLYTDNGFVGSISYVSVYRTGDLPCPSGVDFMQTAIDWHTSVNSQDDALRYFICKGAFATNTNFPFEYKESDAFKESLKIFNTVGFLAEGKYNFIQPNHYIGTTTGENTFYKYNSQTANALSYTENNLCEINQSTNVLLGGSSFTYEAPFKSVSVVFSDVPVFGLPTNQEISNFEFGGSLNANTTYDLSWYSTSELKTLQTNVDSNGITADVCAIYHYVSIKAESSSSIKYLYYNTSNNQYEWSTTQKELVFLRGTRAWGNPPNGLNSSQYSKNQDDNSKLGSTSDQYFTYPDAYTDNNTGNYIQPYIQLNGNLKFEFEVPPLDEFSTISVKSRHDIQFGYTDSSYPFGNYKTTLITPSAVDVYNYSQGITLEAQQESSLTVAENKYIEINAGSSAVENYDLNEVVCGQTSTNTTFAITDINNEPITVNFYRGSNQSGATIITKLLVREFLEMQKSPLQILQGSIQSANISPLDIVKYKLNTDDAAAKYYMFLGGTFKANSEIMEGEWFRIKGD